MKNKVCRNVAVVVVLLLTMSVIPNICCTQQTAPAPQTQTQMIIDGAGREVIVPVEVNRVVSLVSSITQVFYEIGAEDKLVGVTHAQPFPTSYMCPQTVDIPDVGSIANINLEKVIELKPDIVFTTIMYIKQALPLEEKGIKVVAVRLDSASDLLWNIKFIGSLTKKRTEADALAQKAQIALQTVQDRTKELTKDNKPKVYSEIFLGNTFGASVYHTEAIIMAGGINIYGDSGIKYPKPNTEYIISENPEAIIHVAGLSPSLEQFKQKAKDKVDEISARTGWQNLQAIRSKRILIVENRYTSPSTPDYPLYVLSIGKFLHPDLFADYDWPAHVYVSGR